MEVSSEVRVAEDQTRLKIMDDGQQVDLAAILECLRQDLVVLVKGLSPTEADRLMSSIAGSFRLQENLELQAGFAAHQGHRHNIGQYFMSVNTRGDYQFIPWHSEGNSFTRMQLAAFFCYENSTDGGETILMNIDDSSDVWPLLREKAKRGKVASRSLSPREIARVRGLYQLSMPADVLRNDDRVLEERPTNIPGLTVLSVLAQPRRTYSQVLGRDSYTLWDSIASIDSDSADQYAALLKASGLLKQPPGGRSIREMDNTAVRHIWSSGVDYSRIFKCKLTLKLGAGDFIIQNNITWAHSACNWSPSSGTRKLAASFA
jgi:hypothetical protein